MPSRPTSFPFLICAGIAAAGAPLPGAEVSFRNDVQAVIAKAGCNLGTCHGNATGKGGFKMSLRGSDLDLDYAALTQDAGARRVNSFEPDRSLILLKATQALAHEGGKRFDGKSWEYATLRDWLAQGAQRHAPNEAKLEKLEVTPHDLILIEPEKTVQLKATATFSDGTQRDVTSKAVYDLAQVGLVKVSRDGRIEKLKNGEPTVVVRYLDKQQPVRLAFVPARPDFEWTPVRQNNFIDRQVFAKLKGLRMTPSPLCSDEVFVRRLFLDLLGALPTADEARQFVADPSPDKRERLVDRLLARPEFADFWALKWADALRVEPRTMDMRGMTAFHAWIRDAVARNLPVDQFARAILAAQGSTYQVPESNYYRALREPNVRAEAIAQVFLGTRLKCAQCHNHPFDRWTQDDYFNWAAVFARVDYEVKENNRKDKSDKHEFVGEQIVKLTREVKFTNPRTGEAARPKLLGAASLNAATVEGLHDLDAAADWVVNPDNALFARAQANRIWYHLMGRGLVDPVDDFRITNPASHPDLLKALAAEFVESGFDMRHLIRLIVNSRTWQLSSEPNDTNADDQVNCSHALVRRLGAEPLHDALFQFAGVRAEFAAFPDVTRAVALPGPVRLRKKDGNASASDLFLRQFGQPPRLLACECERTNETTMGQAFALISSPQIDDLIRRRDNVITSLQAEPGSWDQKITELFWRALSRPPTKEELAKLTAMVRDAPEDRRRAALEDVAWSLVNAKEFVLRR
jgi:hypothetical protein